MEELTNDTVRQRIVIADLQRRVDNCLQRAKWMVDELRSLKRDLKQIDRQPSLDGIEINPNTPIADLEFSTRVYVCLRKEDVYDPAQGKSIAKINTLNDLLRCTEEDLMAIRGFGQVSLDEVKIRLAELKLHLREA